MDSRTVSPDFYEPESLPTSPPERVKAKSEPAVPCVKNSAVELRITKQISAPSHFASLAENDSPPFRLPGKRPRPMLLIGTIMSEEEAVQMVAASEADPQLGLRKYLATFVVEKKLTENSNLSERDFLVSLVLEAITYAAQRDLSAHKLAVLITIYLATHVYFRYFYWSAPATLWNYFKDIMIRHTIQDSPDGEEVFEPGECYDILTHFHTMYICNLPLVHIRTFGVTRFKLTWPFKKTKEEKK